MELEQIGLKHQKLIEEIKKEYDALNEDYNGAFFIKDYDDYVEQIRIFSCNFVLHINCNCTIKALLNIKKLTIISYTIF